MTAKGQGLSTVSSRQVMQEQKRMLRKVARAQEAFWDALTALERGLGVELDSATDWTCYAGTVTDEDVEGLRSSEQEGGEDEEEEQ